MYRFDTKCLYIEKITSKYQQKKGQQNVVPFLQNKYKTKILMFLLG